VDVRVEEMVMTVAAESSAGEGVLLAGLSGEIPRVRVRQRYKAGLLLAAGVMVILPVVYVGVICLVVYGVYLHAIYDTAIVTEGPQGRGAILTLFAYLAPILVGGLLVAFMVKPLFAKRAQRTAGYALSRSEQRLLYTFVDRLCMVVGARKPSRIDVDCQVNASASFRDGMLGWLRGDVVLTIGLPLVAGLDVRELTGVLAHEFGHFAQGTGMRLTYVVRTINGWFARVAMERDAWDQWLDTVARSESYWAIQATAWLAKLMVWLTRRLLWVLMVAGHAVSSFLLREMEFDADRYEAQVAGSESFATTSRKLAMLTVARTAAFNDLSSAWREKRLCDDLPRLIVAREAAMPGKVRKEVEAMVAKAKTGWLDSHPSDGERIASAMKERAAGLFRVEGPATVLFADFEGLSRRVTALYYRANLGEAFGPGHLVPTASLVAETGEQEKAEGSLARFFQGLVDPLRPVFPDAELEVPGGGDAAAELLVEARRALVERAGAVQDAVKMFTAADERLVTALRVSAMVEAGAAVKGQMVPGLGIMGAVTAEGLTEVMRAAEREREGAAEVVNGLVKRAMVRINVVLAIAAAERKAAAAPAAGAGDAGAGAYDVVEAAVETGSGDLVIDALRALKLVAERVEKLRRLYYQMGAALSLAKPAGNPQSLVNVVVSLGQRLQMVLQEVHGVLRGAKYPYGHAEKGVSVSRFAMEAMPRADEPVKVYHAAEGTLSAVYGLYVRLMSDLARRAEVLDGEVGLEALPEVGG
jgi:Zn-dependent protease with chaperone function